MDSLLEGLPSLMLAFALACFLAALLIPARLYRLLALGAAVLALGGAIARAGGGDGLIAALFGFMAGTGSWLIPLLRENLARFPDFWPPLSELLLLIGLIFALIALVGAITPGLWVRFGRSALIGYGAALGGAFAATLILSAGFGGFREPEEFLLRPGAAQILDGDTLRLGPLRLRLAGIDAPEYRDALNHPEPSKENQVCFDKSYSEAHPCGKAARQALIELAKAQLIVCTRISRGAKDKYGRALVTCVAQAREGHSTDLAEELARGGFVVPTDLAAAGTPDYSAAFAEAQNNIAGVWRWCTMKPSLWRTNDAARNAFILERPPHWSRDEVIRPEACPLSSEIKSAKP